MSERDKDDLVQNLQEPGREVFPSTIYEHVQGLYHKTTHSHYPSTNLSTEYNRSWVLACKNFQIVLEDRCEYPVQIVLENFYAMAT